MTPQEELAEIRQQIEALEARRRSIYERSLSAPEEEKVCADWMAESLAQSFSGFIEYPVTIHGIAHEDRPLLERGMRPIGIPVAVRPCNEACKGKTYLGLLLGDLATSVSVSLHTRTGILTVGPGRHNPAIFVPDLGRIVYGMESWWGPIKSADDLRQITDADIDSVWYVQMLKTIAERGAADGAGDGSMPEGVP
jgi:hypothetical protein